MPRRKMGKKEAKKKTESDESEERERLSAAVVTA